jgi:hypothetical protein
MLVNAPMVVRFVVRSLVGRVTLWCTHDVIQENVPTNATLVERLFWTALIWYGITKCTVVPSHMCATCVGAVLQRRVTWMGTCVSTLGRSPTHVTYVLAALLTGALW